MEEGHYPDRVKSSLEFLSSSKVWHLLSKNSVATSCLDAASRRNRLGVQGIPIYDELKTLCVSTSNGESFQQDYLLHCRAHLSFDLAAAQKLLGLQHPLVKLEEGILTQRYSMRYGTVNPFSQQEKFSHIFDFSVVKSLTPPHTMMTNAGDLSWAIEFRPDELISSLQDSGIEVVIGEIALDDTVATSLPSFGIITGNGPDSGMALWYRLNETINTRLVSEERMRGDISYPKVFVQSIPEMGLSMELEARNNEVWEALKKAVLSFIQQEVNYIVIACNTTQYFSDKIAKLCIHTSSEFVPMADVLRDHLVRHNIQESTLIGIPAVANFGEWSGFTQLAEFGVQPVDEKLLPAIHELGYIVKRLDSKSQDNTALNKLQHVLRNGVKTKYVIVALTEISILLSRYPRIQNKIAGKVIIDTLNVYADWLAQIYVQALPEERSQNDDFWG